MALIECPECHHEVSDTAETCPNCGYRLKPKNYTSEVIEANTKYKIGKTLKEKYIANLILSILLIVLGIVVFVKGFSSNYDEINILFSCLGVFMSLSGVGLLIFAIKKTNPDSVGVSGVVNNYSKSSVVASLGVGAFLIIVGIVYLIVINNLSKGSFDFKYAIYPIFIMCTGIFCIGYGLYRKRKKY